MSLLKGERIYSLPILKRQQITGQWKNLRDRSLCVEKTKTTIHQVNINFWEYPHHFWESSRATDRRIQNMLSECVFLVLFFAICLAHSWRPIWLWNFEMLSTGRLIDCWSACLLDKQKTNTSHLSSFIKTSIDTYILKILKVKVCIFLHSSNDS